MTLFTRVINSDDGSYIIEESNGPYHFSSNAIPTPSVHVRKALKWIRISNQNIKQLKLPDNFQINAMSDVSRCLIESGFPQMAGRVELALYRWLELEADA